jgi:crotonobetainyl-CoA:carnitine CoA-transferase CaiB-like acyl-CoA transferase
MKPPVRFGAWEPPPPAPAPTLGQHTDAVRAALRDRT